MAKINLLPWREKRREKQHKEFVEVSGLAAALGVVVVIGWMSLLDLDISHQEGRNERLKSAITQLDKEIEEVKTLEKRRSMLIDRMKTIESLQSNRPVVVHVFDELVRTLPDGVYYKSINRVDGRIRLEGFAEDNSEISALMRKLENSPWFKTPVLIDVTEKKQAPKSKDPTKNAFQLDVFEEMPAPPQQSAQTKNKGANTK